MSRPENNKLIFNDVKRYILNHEALFKTKKSALKTLAEVAVVEVLQMYSGLKGVYVQGFGSIALAVVYNFLWSHIEYDTKPKSLRLTKLDCKSIESMFQVFYAIMESFGHARLFEEDFKGINTQCISLHHEIKELSADLWTKLFPEEAVEFTIAYFWEYFATLGLHHVPLGVTGQILDLYLLLGQDGVHLLLMGLLSTYKTEILSCGSVDEARRFIKTGMVQHLEHNNLGALVNPQELEKVLLVCQAKKIS